MTRRDEIKSRPFLSNWSGPDARKKKMEPNPTHASAGSNKTKKQTDPYHGCGMFSTDKNRRGPSYFQSLPGSSLAPKRFPLSKKRGPSSAKQRQKERKIFGLTKINRITVPYHCLRLFMTASAFRLKNIFFLRVEWRKWRLEWKADQTTKNLCFYNRTIHQELVFCNIPTSPKKITNKYLTVLQHSKRKLKTFLASLSGHCTVVQSYRQESAKLHGFAKQFQIRTVLYILLLVRNRI